MADECPICGMMPAKFPEWRAQILFTDGTAAHFDSPKDMLKYLKGLDNMGMDKTWIEDTSTIAGVFVTDYSTKEYIDARTAHYVKGSDVQGPMGDDVIPFASMDDAMAFAHEHGGEVIGYDAITKDLLKDLKMKMGGMDMGSESMDTGSMDMGGMDMQNEAMGEELVVVGCG
jgi:nitrous oxide reductase accessory protein NosL